MDILRRINRRNRRAHPLTRIGLILLVIWLGLILYQTQRQLPEDFSLSLPWRQAVNVELLLDQTWQTPDGERFSKQ